jgi:hypothetical protein
MATSSVLKQIKEGTSQFEACQACFQSGGVWTAVGCIPSDPESVSQLS